MPALSLSVGFVATIFFAAEVAAAPAYRLVWSDTTGLGTTGGATIDAAPGDRLTLDVIVDIDTAGFTGAQWELIGSAGLTAEANTLVSGAGGPPECPAPPHIAAGLCMSVTFKSFAPLATGVTDVGPSTFGYDVAGLTAEFTTSALTVGRGVFDVGFSDDSETVDVRFGSGDGLLTDGLFSGLTSTAHAEVIVDLVGPSSDDYRANFLHTATVDNISAQITYIDHPFLNDVPDAVVQIDQNWNPGGGGTYNDHNVGVAYSTGLGQWGIANRDLDPMTVGAHFNVLVVQPWVFSFVHEATVANITISYSLIDHPLINGDPDAHLLVTLNANPLGAPIVWNDHPLGIFYSVVDSKWAVYNQDDAAMSVGAHFNVTILPDDGTSYIHTSSTANLTAHVTTLDDQLLNGDPDRLFYTFQSFTAGGTIGADNPHPTGIYYTGADWAIFNQNFVSMLQNASFFVYLPPEKPSFFTHVATGLNVVSNYSIFDRPQLNDRLGALLFTTLDDTPAGSGTLNPHNTGVFYLGGATDRWSIFNQDGAAMPYFTEWNVYLPPIDLRTFIHRTSVASTASSWSDIGHPLTQGDPNAIVIVEHNWNPNLTSGVYHDRALGVWYNGTTNDWAIFNQDLSTMPVGVSFNVRVADPTTETAIVHEATVGNTAGDVTTIDDPSVNGRPMLVLVVTSNFNPGGGVGEYNDHAVAIGYDSTAERWKIRNQDGADIPVGASFNVVPEPGQSVLLGAGLLGLMVLARRRSRGLPRLGLPVGD